MSKVSYYRAPEGQDIIGKLAFTGKHMGFIGLAMGVIDTQLVSQTKGLLPTLGRICYFTVPCVGMAAAFVSTTYITTNLRQKDDSWNYAFGGVASGAVIGAWRRSAGWGALASLVFAISGVIKKEMVDSGTDFFPNLINQRLVQQSLGARNFDFTLTNEVPGNWTTGSNDNKV